VISVGNLTVGGTGKTPLVIEITEWLLATGKRVAVLSRGYRRTSPEALFLVSDGRRTLATPQDAGDEPYLIAQRCPKAIVAVGADRYRLGRHVVETCGADCMILDDGFQHLGVHRDVNLLLIDATDAAGLDQLLPAGRLREPITAAKRATAIILTRAEQPRQVEDVTTRLRTALRSLPPVAQVTFRASEMVSVMTGESRSLEWAKGKRAVLVSGVGHAASFRTTAHQLGVTILEEMVFPDHHLYTAQEIGSLHEGAHRLQAELVLTTEKDAAKIRPYVSSSDVRWWAARLRVEWLTGEAPIREMIMEARRATGEGIGA
jgi:tetraacyldisaccharide 4'-kinase